MPSCQPCIGFGVVGFRRRARGRARASQRRQRGRRSVRRAQLAQRDADAGARKPIVRHRDAPKDRSPARSPRSPAASAPRHPDRRTGAASPENRRAAARRTAARGRARPSPDAPDRDARRARIRPAPARSRRGCACAAAVSAARGCAALPGSCRSGGGIGWNTSIRPTRLTNTRCGLAARMTPIAGIAGLEHRTARAVRASSAATRGIGHAHAGVDLQRVEAEIEQDRAAIVLRAAPRGRGRARSARAPVHGAGCLRQAERDAMAPAVARRALGGHEPHAGARLEPDAAARGDRRHRAASRAPSSTGSPASRVNSASAPNVPRLQCVSQSAKLRGEKRNTFADADHRGSLALQRSWSGRRESNPRMQLGKDLP